MRHEILKKIYLTLKNVTIVGEIIWLIEVSISNLSIKVSKYLNS